MRLERFMTPVRLWFVRCAQVLAITAVCAVSPVSRAAAQPVVFLNDDPAAGEALRSLPGLIERGELSEAVREIQRLLEGEPGRVLPEPDGSGVHRSARDAVLEFLLDRPELLERYREVESPRARDWLVVGDLRVLEQTHWATREGFAGSLSLAAERFESGSFDAATITLHRLTRHPDASDNQLGPRAAALASELAAYHAPARRVAERWAALTGGAFEAPLAIEPPTRTDAADALRGGRSSLVEPIPQEPAWSVDLGVEPGRRRDGTQQEARSYPLLSGELLVVNTGGRITAWDRYTLSRRWRYEVPAELGRVMHGNDPYPVTATPIGLLVETPLRGGGASLSLLERSTGEPRWTVPSVVLGQGLSSAEVVGAPLVVGGRVVVVLDAVERLRRLRSIVVVGLDLASGEVAWRRTLGSSGVQRSNRGLGPSHAPAAHEGVVYLSSSIGLAAAIEADTGRLRWLRPIVSDVELNPILRTRPEHQSSMVVWEDRVLFVAPDRRSVIALDMETGRELQRRVTDGSAPPAYAQLWGDRLLLVTRNKVLSVPAADISERGQTLATYPVGTLVGRTMVAGDQLVIPLADEIGFVGLSSGAAESTAVEHSGSIVVGGGQLIAVGDGQAHVYLSWSVAQRELLARMEATPDDAGPAITYTRLAVRAERYSELLGAVDRAIGALARRDNEADRKELFAAVREALAQRGGSLDSGLRSGLLSRLGLIARTPEHRSVQRLLLAASEHASGRSVQAVDALQEVLDDEALAQAIVDDGRVRTRSGDVATARLREIVRAQGAGVYEFYTQRALRELDGLGPDAPDEAYRSLARRHPLAPASSRAWLRLADRALASGDRSGEVRALLSGLSPLWSDSGVDVAELGLSEEAGRIVGRLVNRQREQGRTFAAVQTLRRCAEALPGVTPTFEGEPIDVAAELAALRDQLASDTRFPRIAGTMRGPTQVISGWRVVEPLIHDGGAPPTGHVLMRSRTASLVALWAGGDPESGGFESGQLRAVWSRQASGRDPQLLRLDPEAAYLIWNEPNGISVERVDTVTGKTDWRTEPLWDMLGAEPNVRLLQGVVETPLDGPQRLANIVVAMDKGSLVLVQRDGQAVAVDLDTGEPRWTRAKSDMVVFEAAARDGVFALIGRRRTVRGAPGAEPVVLLFDLETGRARRVLADLVSSPRWVRLAEGGRVVVGLDGGVALYSHGGERRWLNRDPGLQLSADAWLMAERCVVMGPDRGLRMLSLDDGTFVGRSPLDEHGRVVASDRVRAWTQGERVIFGTQRGLALFGYDGSLAGVDALESSDDLVIPALGLGVAVTASRPTARTPQGEYLADVWFLSTDSGELLSRQPVLLGARPDRVTLIDGRVLITAAGVTLVYEAEPKALPDPAPEPIPEGGHELPGEL